MSRCHGSVPHELWFGLIHHINAEPLTVSDLCLIYISLLYSVVQSSICSCENVSFFLPLICFKSVAYIEVAFSNYQLNVKFFYFQQYICYTTIFNMFRAARCSSSGGKLVLLLHLHTVRLFTEGDDTRGCGDTIGPPEDEQLAARNMLRIVV